MVFTEFCKYDLPMLNRPCSYGIDGLFGSMMTEVHSLRLFNEKVTVYWPRQSFCCGNFVH